MFCPKCGAQIPDNSAFCHHCGQAVGSQPGSNQQYVNYNPYQQPCAQTVVAPQGSQRVVDKLKSAGSSPLFLISVIAFSLAIVISLITSVYTSTSSNFADTIMILANKFGVDYDIYITFTTASVASSIFSAVMSSLPSILVAIGLWLTYSSAISKNNRMKTSGLTLVKVIMVFYMVALDVLFGICEIIFLISSVAATSYGVDDGTTILLVVFNILIIAIIAFINVYYAFVIKSINTAKRVAVTGVASDKVSSFVGVLCIISAVGTALTLIANLVIYATAASISFGADEFGEILSIIMDYYYSTDLMLFTLLGLAMTLTADLCFGILIFKFKGSMRKLISEESEEA
ncbi:MAG: zinc ribbon domain-containing protein [Ruminococcus sp.]|nr:zinc ribbon domain-containing protein [Ruminococcus sp.]